ncbi:MULTISPECIES: hypothetical protein [Pseudomonas]|uniref:Uncharacterized protein n=1 Tax=Pseudomonas bijieensis TaxID=2681983 RepID=A0A6N1C8S1_9PSED|nr:MULTISPECIES: hypothetical protein [Pseudomonas]QIB03550.1 hypothetical protein GZ982_02245 [Pseudomonas fluorescens]QKS81584.1 hypothetical protein GN234_06345 [Pseudomonas bijieensis]WLH65387.1 hypothetical protein PSH86_12720 [Pseudomonas sp. FP2300]
MDIANDGHDLSVEKIVLRAYEVPQKCNLKLAGLLIALINIEKTRKTTDEAKNQM